MPKPSADFASLNDLVVLRLPAVRPAHMGCIAVLTIANRLGANQALGDMIERVARVQSLG
jgi:hypothetical protein